MTIFGEIASIVADQPWAAGALCAQTDPEMFYPPAGEKALEAKRICSRCEVRDECLAYALKHVEMHGVWGGKSSHERRTMRTESRRNR